MQKRNRILVVGQTPPPYGGQAIMIEKIVGFRYDDIVFFHVRMNFSTDMDDIGRVKFSKVIELFRVICLIYKHRLFHGVRVMYYPPAGPDLAPIVRDIVILLSTRFLFRKTIFHFHAGGLSEKFKDLKPVLQWLFRKAYGKPDLSIQLSRLNPDDGNFVNSKKNVIIPYGIDDVSVSLPQQKPSGNTINILFTGVLKESKGATDLIKAVAILKNEGVTNLSVSLMGKFDSEEYERELKSMISENGLDGCINVLGVKTGLDKFNYFSACDIFCFPSFFESETFGIVLLEAMQFSKPIVTTRWRGIPDVVKDGTNGILVDIRNVKMLAEALKKLIEDKDLRETFGRNGRRIYLENFTTDVFKQNFYNAVRSIVADEPGKD